MGNKESLAWMESEDSASGEPITGFEHGADKGPFNCGNCVHMEKENCKHPIMIKLSNQPKTADGVKVDSDDCCTYVRRKGEKEEDEDAKDKD